MPVKFILLMYTYIYMGYYILVCIFSFHWKLSTRKIPLPAWYLKSFSNVWQVKCRKLWMVQICFYLWPVAGISFFWGGGDCWLKYTRQRDWDERLTLLWPCSIKFLILLKLGWSDIYFSAQRKRTVLYIL